MKVGALGERSPSLSPNLSPTYSAVESPRLLSSVVFHHVHSLFWHAFQCVCVCARAHGVLLLYMKVCVGGKAEVDCHLVAEFSHSLRAEGETRMGVTKGFVRTSSSFCLCVCMCTRAHVCVCVCNYWLLLV